MATPVGVDAQSRFVADASIGVGASTNPFLDPSGDGSLFAELTLEPRYEIRDELGETILEGRFRSTQYLEDIGDTEEYGASARTERRLDPTTRAAAWLSFSSSIVGARGNDIFSGPEGPDPIGGGVGGEPAEPLEPDVSLAGFRQRRNLLMTGASVSKRLSEVDTIDAEIDVSRSTFPGDAIASDYSIYEGALRFRRAFSPRLSAGVRGTVQRIDSDPPAPSATVYQAQIVFDYRLSPLWAVDGGAGVLFIDAERSADSRDSLGFAGNVNACREDERSSFCAGAFRDATGAGIGGVRKRLGVYARYNYRLDEYDFVRLNADYTHVGRSAGTATLPNFLDQSDLFTVRGEYEKRLSRRLAIGAQAEYRDTFRADLAIPADVTGQVFLRVTMGETR